MRRKTENILELWAENDPKLNKVVREYRNEYKAAAKILDSMPGILDLAHRDLQRLCKATTKRGRKPSFTSENLLRAIIVMQREGLDYREAAVRIAESETLQNFCRLRKKKTMDYSLINKAYCAISPETWEAMNRSLTINAVQQETITPEHVRTDTTVTECNIHWPTDASLLWDVYRVIAREIACGRAIDPLATTSRFHVKKIKKLYLFIGRHAQSRCKKRLRLVRSDMKTLILKVEKALEKAASFIEQVRDSWNLKLMAIGASLAKFLPWMQQVAAVARRRAFDGEKVPNSEKVFSIFEPHAELIKRGRRGKPIEFGHKILLTQSREKFITDYVVLEENRSDNELLPLVLERHEDIFGEKPKTVAGDKGFCPDADTYEELQEEVEYLGVPRRTQDFAESMMRIWQHWRAGIEGSISCLKRVFRLARCHFQGFKNFTSAIGSAVFCHNLTILTKLDGG